VPAWSAMIFLYLSLRFSRKASITVPISLSRLVGWRDDRVERCESGGQLPRGLPVNKHPRHQPGYDSLGPQPGHSGETFEPRQVVEGRHAATSC